MKRKVLITGGAGFIGCALGTAFAEAEDQVDLLDNFARGARDPAFSALLSRTNVRLHEIDLLRDGALANFDRDYTHIFHFAAIVGVENVLRQPYLTLRNNLLLLTPVIELARRQKQLQRLVFASTSEVYAGSIEFLDMPIPTPETTQLALMPLSHPRTSYMLSKIYGEALVCQSGLPFTILRPHNIYGPRMGMAHVIPQLFQKAHQAAAGSSIEVFSPLHTRTFCYIDDAVRMIRSASTADAGEGQVLNLGVEKPEITIEKLAKMIVACVGKPLSLSLAETTPGSPARRCPAMDRMKSVTGFSGQIALEDGVARTYQWYKQHVFECVPQIA